MKISLFAYMEKYFPDTLEMRPFIMGSKPLNFWQRLFKPEHISEKKRPVKSGVDWPYANRLGFLARKFATLTPAEKEIVIAARKDQIFWMGDEIEFFNTVIDEMHDYRDLDPEQQEKYRQKALQMATSLKARHGRLA
ncbi:hypothetical protein [Candidatus Methylomicrobium oryzae]|uniref:hypothetical protein n=1 Tax=Candidatus Methylomicrobium oryzae TaxID=2802053 RepID=UPI0019218CDC|nr:hypothetical protein [Methylomicrobium sp. RS1]MBL1265724.1 hypothetical protein [Methylomicrobium sp. RS1]